MIHAGDEEEVRKVVWFALGRKYQYADLRYNGMAQTSVFAHLISLASMLYMGGTTCTGMLTRRSQRTRPTWASDCEKSAFRVSWNAGSWLAVVASR